MWKISYFFLLIIAFDKSLTFESARLKGDGVTNSERNYNNRKYQLDVDETDYEDDYDPAEESEEFQGGRLIGRWRNNGEAIEPKWRDGDSIPLVPFEEAATLRKATPKPTEKLPIDERDILNHTRSTNKYRETQDEHLKKIHMNAPALDIKSRSEFVPVSKQIQNHDREKLHEPLRHNDYANIPRNGSYRARKQKPLEFPAEKAHSPLNYRLEPVHQTTALDNNPKLLGNIDIKVHFDAGTYQNPLQVHPNDYELDDAEYHRPRSRKRRPPQNYEYVETKMHYPPLDFWQKSSNSSTIATTNESRLNNFPNENQKNSENSQLKSLLKMQQVEGLSLSEILQRRNLTLGDLLNRKIEVINALKSRDDEAIGYRVSHDKSIVQTQPIIKQRASSERPKFMANRRVRVKEMRRESTPTPISTTTTTTTTTTIYKTVLKEIPFDTKNETTQTKELSIVDNKRKLRDNERLQTVINQTEPMRLLRLNSSRTLPVNITTTITAIVKDPVIQYDTEKHSTIAYPTDDEEIMEFSDFAEKKHRDSSSISSSKLSTTTAKSQSSTITNEESMVIARYNDVDKDLESTLSIEHILLPTPTTISTLITTIKERDDDNKSNTLTEYNGSDNDADPYNADEMEYQNDAPRNDGEERNDESVSQMSVNFSKSTKIHDGNQATTVRDSDKPMSFNHQSLSSQNKIYDRVISELEPEARAEIFELISTGASAQRMEQLLKSRNMSIDELISLRQRGSSRLHLADISRLRLRSHKNKTRGDQIFSLASVPKINSSKLITTTITPELTDDENSSKLSTYSTLDDINEQMNKNNETNRRFIVVDKTPIIIKISSRTGKENKNAGIITQKDPEDLVDLLSVFDSLPFAIYNNCSLTSNTESTTVINTKQTIESQTVDYNSEAIARHSEVTTTVLQYGLVDEIVKKTQTIGEELSTNEENYTFVPRYEDERKSLSKVRPSIIASGAILGMTIIGFLAIFIVCRIRQKQKYMYKNSFSKAVFQAPVMNSRKLSNSSSLNTIMVNVVATSTAKRSMQHGTQEIQKNFDTKSDIDNDSLDANDSWDTIPDFMK